MARHRSDYAGERLTAKRTFQFAPSESARLDAMAAEMQIKPSDLLRQFMASGLQTLEKTRPQREGKRTADAGLAEQLNRLGVALNAEAERANRKDRLNSYDPVTIANLVPPLVAALASVTKHEGRQAMTAERRKLLAAVNWIGNNVQQLAKAASKARDRQTAAQLALIEVQIVATCETATP